MRKILLSLILLALSALPMRAEESPIRDVIAGQIAAFQQDDFAKAFTFASPAIKQIFQNPERFGVMVRQGYPMVWRPAQVRFGALRRVDGRMVQTVFLTDQTGKVFEASYEMIETGPGWKINGVALKEMDLGA